MRQNPVLPLTVLVLRSVLTIAASLQILLVNALLDAHGGTVKRKGNVKGLVETRNVPNAMAVPSLLRTLVLVVVGTVNAGVTLTVLLVPGIVIVLPVRTMTVSVDAPLPGTVHGTVDARR